MDKLNLQLRSDILNGRKIPVEIPVIKYTWIDRLLRKPAVRRFEVVQATYGVLEQIGALVQNMQPHDVDGADKNYYATFLKNAANSAVLYKVLACLISGDPYPSKRLETFLKNNLFTDVAKDLLIKLLQFSNIESFSLTIILTKGMSLKPEEIIASENNEEIQTHSE